MLIITLFCYQISQREENMGSADEVVIIVDEENNEIGAVPRREMRAVRLPHRAT